MAAAAGHGGPRPHPWRGAVIGLLFALTACTGTATSSQPAPSTPSASPSGEAVELERFCGGAGNCVLKPVPTIPFNLRPYPYTTPVPPEEPTELDGTYLRVLTLEEVGGAPQALPIKCLRCPPYRLTPGVSTLILYRGEFYVHHQMSDFHAVGHFAVDGDRVTLSNDVHCTREHAIYDWNLAGGELTFELVDDPCTYAPSRAKDLTFGSWTRVNPCTYKLTNLWPAEVAC